MLDFRRFEYLTFDCYGTLIDWETGILNSLKPILAAYGHSVPDAQILENYAELEARAEAGAYKTYREVLQEVVRGLGSTVQPRFRPTEREIRSLPESVKDWRPFPDTVAALRELKARYKLAIISNIDDDLFAATARRLEVPFDAVITAQQAGSYKPSLKNFHLAIESLGVSAEKILHIAQSLYHDIAPAKLLGLATVWVNRRAGKAGGGATVASTAAPDVEVPSLKALVELTQQAIDSSPHQERRSAPNE